MDRNSCTDGKRRCSAAADDELGSRRFAGSRTLPTVRRAWWKTLTFIQQFGECKPNFFLEFCTQRSQSDRVDTLYLRTEHTINAFLKVSACPKQNFKF
ncbi:hypothetical protein TNIN_357981 [Trichonephila inaurata madagascariensis]|uniref:Uncharacterized protein n=1 Tax=Trichonephila inaurata madagascariensis TaxID=2747483 RepID=A0A8X6MKQ0_9ARAC|nr:hypothetical protein TNIN_357981 [Trichonephila inaurata madagascariensis]